MSQLRPDADFLNEVGFPEGSVVKNLPDNAGDTGSIPIQEDPTCHGAIKTLVFAPTEPGF